MECWNVEKSCDQWTCLSKYDSNLLHCQNPVPYSCNKIHLTTQKRDVLLNKLAWSTALPLIILNSLQMNRVLRSGSFFHHFSSCKRLWLACIRNKSPISIGGFVVAAKFQNSFHFNSSNVLFWLIRNTVSLNENIWNNCHVTHIYVYKSVL